MTRIFPGYFELLTYAAPQSVLVIAALAVLAVDLWPMRSESAGGRRLVSAAVAGMGCLVSMLCLINVTPTGRLLDGMLVADSLTRLVMAVLLVLAACTVLLSIGRDFTKHVGEYFALLLLATSGMMFLVSTENLLAIFLSLELTSLSLYVLVALDKRKQQSAEAALKYFLFGGMAAAFTLFGLSLIYGLSGQLNLRMIASAVPSAPTLNPTLLLAMILTVIGFGFKVAAVPFHLWAPDAYQGAPTPSAALIASGSKVASFFVLAKVMLLGFAGTGGSSAWMSVTPGWVPLLAILAALSMILGNVAAIAQSNVKRLLAYSAIAHAGYALLGVLSNNQQGIASLLYYAITYALTVLGAFGVVALVEESAGDSQLASFAGLSSRAPVLSLCMMVFMLSLAGIPPFAGFFGKFYVFVAAAKAGPESLGLLWLVILAIAMSAVSLYYYLQVLKQVYVAEAPAVQVAPSTDRFTLGAVVFLALAVVVLGCLPELLTGRILSAFGSSGL